MTTQPFPRWAKITLIAMPVTFIVVVAALLVKAVAEPEPSPPVPVSVATADPTIRTMATVGDNLVIDLKVEAGAEKDFAFAAGDAARNVGRALQNGATDSGEASNITMAVTTGSVDKLGKAQDFLLMTVVFNRADLVSAQLDQLTVGRVLNLATDVQFGPQGARALSAYCATDRGRAQSSAFCDLAARRA